jgi:hypothetical protein
LLSIFTVKCVVNDFFKMGFYIFMRNGNVQCRKPYEPFDISALYITIPHDDR